MKFKFAYRKVSLLLLFFIYVYFTNNWCVANLKQYCAQAGKGYLDYSCFWADTIDNCGDRVWRSETAEKSSPG